MSRPQSAFVPLVRARVLAGDLPKMIAYEIGMTPSAISKMISNMPDLRKQYITDIEYAQIIKQRKATK